MKELAVMGGEMPTRFRDWGEFERACARVGMLKNELPWYIGRLMLAGEATFHERVYQILPDNPEARTIFGYRMRSVRNFMGTARTIGEGEYTSQIEWSYWEAMASVKDSEKRADLISRCLSNQIKTRQELRLLVDNSHAGVRISTNGAGNHMTNGTKTRQIGVSAQLRPLLARVLNLVPTFVDAGVWLDREIEKTGDYQAGSMERFRDAWDELAAAVVELEEKRGA